MAMEDVLKSKVTKGATAGGGVVALIIYMMSVIQTNAAEEKKQLIHLVEEKFNTVTVQIVGISDNQERVLNRLDKIDDKLYELKRNVISSLDEPVREEKPNKL